MATLDALITRLRLELTDQPSVVQFRAVCDGTTTRFELPNHPVSGESVSLYNPNTLAVTGLTAGIDYSIDYTAGVVFTLGSPWPAGDALLAQCTAYRYFTDSDLTTFINTAFTQHTHNATDTYGQQQTMATLPGVEEYLVVILAMIEALWVLATDAAYDIDIHTNGVSIPRSERFNQLATIIATRQKEYDGLAQALNVGLNRVEQYILRRVSRTTNKYVPIYLPQEVNDNRPPVQVFPPIDTDGQQAMPVPTPLVGSVDLTALGQNSFSYPRVLGIDVTGLTVSAHCRGYPNSLSSLSQFALVVNNASTGDITLTLTQYQTFALPERCWYDIQSRDSSNNVQLLQQGSFFTMRQGSPA